MSKLTKTVQTKIVEALSNGVTRTDAAAYAGIGRQTLYDWLAKGTGDKPREPYKGFAKAVEEAEAGVVMTIMRELMHVGMSGQRDQWKALTWMMERRFPKQWAQVNRHEVTGKDQEPVKVDVLQKLREHYGMDDKDE